jgi:hypothetical protein
MAVVRPEELNTVTSMRVRATADGRIVGWAELKEGSLVDTTRLSRLFFTTTLTDVIADLCAWSQEFDSSYRIAMLIPNGPVSVSLDLKLVGTDFEVVCARRLVRGWFPLNPIAAEYGCNYDVVVTVSGNSDIATEIAKRLRTKYSCSE